MSSGSLYYTGFNDDIFLLSFLSFCLLAFFHSNKNLSKKYLYYSLFFILFLIIHPFVLLNIGLLNTYLGYVVRIVSFLLVISILGYQKFSILYIKIMLILCSLNLILYFDHVYLLNLFDPLASLLPELKTWDNLPFSNYLFYFSPSHTTSHSSLIRNSGIFWEGGAYQYFLNLALIINLYFHRRPVFSFSNWIFVISILTTFSTVGYTILIIVLVYKTFGKSYERHMYMKRLIILPFIILFLASSTVIVDKLFNKESQVYQISTLRRMQDSLIDYTVFIENPLLGIGLGNKVTWQTYSDRFGGGTGSSNGLLHFLGKVGIFGLLIGLYPFLNFKLNSKKNKMIILCNFFSVLSQGLIFTPIFFLSMSLLNQKSLPR